MVILCKMVLQHSDSISILKKAFEGRISHVFLSARSPGLNHCDFLSMWKSTRQSVFRKSPHNG
jgi:hypothetical protein